MKFEAIATSIFFMGSLASSQAVMMFVDAGFDRSGWEAAVTGTITNENFDTLMGQSDTLNFPSGLMSVASGATGSPNHLVSLNAGTSSNTLATTLNTATSAVNGYTSVTWTFPTAVYAFGADFLSIGGSREVGPTGVFDSGSQHFILRDLFGGDQGFFGVVSTTPFTQITLEATGSIASNDSIRIDNAAFAVPEPSSLALLGLGGMFAFMRRR